jgi:polyhydroxyalkanoate synthesis regulator phasin
MAQPLDVKRLLATGKQITQTGRTHAVQLGTDLVEQGRQATDQISAVVDELVNRGGRERIEDLRQTVRGEMQRELRTLRESLNEDLAKIESAVDRIVGVVKDVTIQRRGHVEELRQAVRDEVQRHMSTLGLATREDLAALGRTIGDDLAALESRLERQVASPTTASEESARHEAALQMTPPHARGTVIAQPTT